MSRPIKMGFRSFGILFEKIGIRRPSVSSPGPIGIWRSCENFYDRVRLFFQCDLGG